jgi:hypothetical protein
LDLSRDRLEAHRIAVRQRPNASLAEDEEPEFRTAMISDAELDGFISELGVPALKGGPQTSE